MALETGLRLILVLRQNARMPAVKQWDAGGLDHFARLIALR